GNFDRFIEDTRGKRPRAEIDRDFLNDLDKWRITLARNIALRNPELSERALNHAVQLTIDRLIFLRMSEDRDIEQYGSLQALSNGVNIYPRLVQLYYKADARYNSGLFHFDERGGENPDTLTPGLTIDDKVIKEIISELYYPKCPYEFSVLPVEVLGNAYEQFLGKRITLTQGHRARIEEKPEVRKAGGVYYTPQYIVDYIVKNTVGKLCENKSPAQVSQLRALDPACGSGSFLLGAYQYLLDWHRDWYRSEHEKTGKVPAAPTTDGKRKRKSDPQPIFQGKGGEWYLTTAEKKRILINNIYGVDIDANAVEVTKLSLLLKVLEHETSETLNRQLGLWQERALPNLESNIKCGNSLIGTDFYQNRQSALFDEEEALRINAFDWEREFPEVFASGGFDAVIGNPPYIQLSMADYYDNASNIYLSKNYSSSMGRLNTFGLFIEKVIQTLLAANGKLSFIVPNTLLTQEYYQSLRKEMLKYRIGNITTFKYPVFADAVVETIIFVINNMPPGGKIDIIDLDNKLMTSKTHSVEQDLFQSTHRQAFLVKVDNKKFELKIK
ncbi:MAG: DNA methyltransferase, partial [bacterium]|nr:DNA methyltransferase [bacterium]